MKTIAATIAIATALTGLVTLLAISRAFAVASSTSASAPDFVRAVSAEQLEHELSIRSLA
jgi:hypothetical protein